MTANSDTVCLNNECNIEFTFTNGGSITSNNLTVLSFGDGGSIKLGTLGSLVLGKAGKLSGVTLRQLENGGSIDPLSEIVLGSDSHISFGAEGSVSLGLGGNIRYIPGTIVNIDGADIIRIKGTPEEEIRISEIDSAGTVNLVANEIQVGIIAQQPAGIHLNSQDVLSQININAGALIVDNISAAAVLSLGVDNSSNGNCNFSSGDEGAIIITAGSLFGAPSDCSLSIGENPGSGSVSNNASITITVDDSSTNETSQSDTTAISESGGGAITWLLGMILLVNLGRRYMKVKEGTPMT